MARYRIHKPDGSVEEICGKIEKLVTPEEVARTNTLADISDSNQFIKDTFGSFFFFWYSEALKEEYDMAYMVRLLYMASFINYDNVMTYSNGKKIKKKDLEKILQLSRNETYKTIKYLVENSLVYIDEQTKVVSIDEKCIKKGSINMKKEKLIDIGAIRVFNQGIKELYPQFNAKSHKTLGWFIKLLPYVNIHYNILCSNPLEEDMELIKPLSWKNIKNMVGGKTDSFSKNKNRFINTVIKEQCLICQMKFNKKSLIFVNPNLFYKGNKIEYMQIMCDVFKNF